MPLSLMKKEKQSYNIIRLAKGENSIREWYELWIPNVGWRWKYIPKSQGMNEEMHSNLLFKADIYNKKTS